MHRQINLFRSEFGAIHRFCFTPVLAFTGLKLHRFSSASGGRISKDMQAADNNNDLIVTASSNEEQWWARDDVWLSSHKLQQKAENFLRRRRHCFISSAYKYYKRVVRWEAKFSYSWGREEDWFIYFRFAAACPPTPFSPFINLAYLCKSFFCSEGEYWSIYLRSAGLFFFWHTLLQLNLEH